MNKQTRVLAYRKADELSTKELAEVSGGMGVNSLEMKLVSTGAPIPSDVEWVQVWD
jgi:bacteriocin-like protein